MQDRREEDDHRLALLEMLEERVQVVQVVAVEEALVAGEALEIVVKVARRHRRIRLGVRDEGEEFFVRGDRCHMVGHHLVLRSLRSGSSAPRMEGEANDVRGRG